ncbi:MAG: acyltransferase [Proteobacteria bacterium]|nr:MAG: acyltransferase [Pseudomonadota bacterium]
MQASHLNALTGMRFIAALLVLASHLWPARLGTITDPFYRSGFIGVSFFFVLSGFILGYSHLHAKKHIELRKFYWARFSRIYPVYLLGALLILILDLQKFPVRAAVEFAASLTLLQAWFGEYALVGNGVGWSLSVEAFFYAVFPFLAKLVAPLNTRSVLLVLGYCWIAALIPQLAAVYFEVPNVNRGLGGFFKFFPLFHLPEFIAGLLLARLKELHPPTFKKDFTYDLLLLVSLFGIWLLTMSPMKMPWPLTFTGGAVMLFCTMIYLLSVDRGVCARFLGSKSLVSLGTASYAMYILHPGLHELTHHLFPPRSAHFLTLEIVVVSLAVHKHIEVPSRLLLLQLRRPTSSIANVTAIK